MLGTVQSEDDSYRLQSVEVVVDLVSSLEIDLEISVPFAIYTKEDGCFVYTCRRN
ncbi:hypothetical protein KOY48_03030 [Candidatus Minimicrobia naudis]|uniref:Uncharacterized protein n=1 Tax=Candidatus Minimicrobia naudis TaxID=2841263 RepID=A0A8F1MB86_9BACT|nr:hypothetical protein KOY48_03030 [Candidatus Minimicrobia naudis]